MRRSFLALTFIAALFPIASIAYAQDAQPQTDAGAPTTTTPVATTTTAPTPTPTQTQAPVVTIAPASNEQEQEVYRLGRMIEAEAARARTHRYGSSAVQMVLGGGAVVSSALIFTLDFTGVDSGLQTMIDIVAIAGIVAGGLTMVDGLISLFVSSPMERLFERYAPIAIDTSLTPSDRLRRGEMMLEAMSNAEHSTRVTGGVSNIVLGAIEAGLAIFFAADNDLWGVGDPNAPANRAIFATAFGLAAASSIGDGIGKLVWERGPAEVAWEHWHTSHGHVTVQTSSKVRFKPLVGPTRNGGMVGLSLTF